MNHREVPGRAEPPQRAERVVRGHPRARRVPRSGEDEGAHALPAGHLGLRARVGRQRHRFVDQTSGVGIYPKGGELGPPAGELDAQIRQIVLAGERRRSVVVPLGLPEPPPPQRDVAEVAPRHRLEHRHLVHPRELHRELSGLHGAGPPAEVGEALAQVHLDPRDLQGGAQHLEGEQRALPAGDRPLDVTGRVPADRRVVLDARPVDHRERPALAGDALEGRRRLPRTAGHPLQAAAGALHQRPRRRADAELGG